MVWIPAKLNEGGAVRGRGGEERKKGLGFVKGEVRKDAIVDLIAEEKKKRDTNQPMGLPVRSGSVQVRVRLTTTQAGSSSKAVDRLEKQLSFQKSVDVRSASPRTGSLENGSKLHAEKKKPWTFLVVASSGVSGMNAGGDESVEIVIRYILSDSMHVMTKRFQEMLMR
ncbi:unnamed protein product [Brassica napus]|uniref:Uncharacterized protein n=3 Tax=Brassica TaxID=3705 RepID=A0A0D3D0F2_BRAOL|nr:unnamed protein product [Brassica napus]